MAENSSIEWCDHTFNPWEGCQKVGPGCDNCYAEARDKRFTGGTHWGPGAPRRRTSPANWHQPLRWNLRAATEGRRARVFCASLADVFDNAVPPEWRDDLFRLIASTPHLDWLLLTKRPGNIAAMLPFGWGAGWHNVWLGCTVVNQTEADRDIPKLLAVPAAVRFLSMEPLLGPVDLLKCPTHGTAGGSWDWLTGVRNWHSGQDATPRIDWVIVGGESGPNARPMHPDWARSIRDQCQAAGVPFLFKQWGEWQIGASRETRPEWTAGTMIEARTVFGYPAWIAAQDKPWSHLIERFGKRAAGRLLDGRTWDEAPR
jgi:protein gp37